MYNNPVFWEQGLFLQPQHLQLEQRQYQVGMGDILQLLQPWFWGVRRLEVNETALGSGILELNALELFLPSGERVALHDNATLPPRSFQQVWTTPEVPLLVSVGLSPFRNEGNNVAQTDFPGEASDQFRFTTPLSPDQFADMHGDGPRADVRTLRYNLRLCFGDEGADMERFPVARLLRDGERVLVDTHFAPPCVDMNAVPPLVTLVRDVRDTLLSRSKQLEEYKIIPGETKEYNSTALSSLQGVTLFSLLSVLCRHAPNLEQLLSVPAVHPWTVYGALCRLVGELSVFSGTFSPLGETLQGEKVLPSYDHQNLYECYAAATAIISRLVDTLVVGPAYTFVLEPRNGVLGTVMPQEARSNAYAYWLLLRTSQRKHLEEQVVRLGKLAPTPALAGIMARALPGIRLTPADQPPAGLPRRPDTLYFMIDQADSLWRQVLQHGEVAFVLPGQPEDMLAQLTIIQR